ncbi:short-chain dehydrogenase [Candidatus Marinamargulisbacteria bacterium SCGC AG-343-D04]|nr:short-chain dehydrogenase [Candidatus Marinamargulisbacteria bacterium SCGC AG-343-D04]
MKPIVLITGCSSGFGMLTALELAATCHVIATVRNKEKERDLFNHCSHQQLNIDIQYCDVTDPESIQKVAEHIETSYKRLDVLINNAGYGLGGYFEDLEDSEIRDLFNTNVFGLQRVTKAVLPLLRQSKSAKIINLSSIAGLTASPCISAYNASKWAVEGFSEALLFELLPFNIDVVLVEPGQFNTKIFSSNLRFAKGMKNPQSPYYSYSQKAMKKLNGMIQKGLADPKKVTQLIVKVVFKKKPKTRYLIGWDAYVRLYLRRLLPFEWYKKIVGALYLKLMHKS